MYAPYVFNPPKNQKNNFLVISGSSFYFLNWYSKFFSEKRIHNTFQIRGDKTQTQQVNFRMKWVVLYSEETKCIEVKTYPFSCNQVYY